MTIMASPVAGEINSATAEMIANNQDLLLEILLRLPTKSLLQLRCVSKHWCSLISTPQFHRHHCRHHAATSTATGLLLFRTHSMRYIMDHLIYLPNSKNSNKYSRAIRISIRLIHYPSGFSGFYRVHSCNGLLCIGVMPYSPPYCCTIYVYNPSTCRYASLSIPDKHSFRIIEAINLAFDPVRSDFYRIVCLEAYKNFGYKILIYASESGEWKDTGKFVKHGDEYFLERGVFLQGCLHWVAKNEPFLAFDVENEMFREIPSTRVPESGRKICYFGDWGGRLHVIQESDGGASLVDVMELKTDYSEWSLKYRVDIGDLGRRIEGNAGGIEIDILCLVKANGEGKTMLIVSAQGRIFAYNIIGNTFEEVCDVSKFPPVKQDPSEYKYQWCQAFKHFETLACP